MSPHFEHLLTRHCAPAIMGAKVSNLVMVRKEDYPDIGEILKHYNILFSKHKLKFAALKESEYKHGILVYNQDMMVELLECPRIRQFLKKYGYDLWFNAQDCIKRLKERLQNGKEFPHEIGVFLGYALDDVDCFIKHKGKHYTFCGYWKVYDNPKEKMETFKRYDRCREALETQLDHHGSLQKALH